MNENIVNLGDITFLSGREVSPRLLYAIFLCKFICSILVTYVNIKTYFYEK